MTKKLYFVGLDIGSSRIKASCCEIVEGEPVLSVSLNGPSSGLKDGVVIDINNLSSSVADVVDKLSMVIDSKITSVIANISGTGVTGEISNGVVTLDQRSSEITEKDVKNVLSIARALPIGIEREIMHLVPRDYKIDNQKGVINPIGLFGTRLEVDSYIISARITQIQNIVKAINCAGLEVEEMVYSGLATASSVLSAKEKLDGVVIIDIGADFTEISIFIKGNLEKISIIDFGGNDFDEAISTKLKIKHEYAESIKNRFGAIVPGNDNVNSKSADNFSNYYGVNFNRKELLDILQDSAKELFGKIRAEIDPYKNSIFTGAYIAGGLSMMDGLLEFAETELGMPSRLAIPKIIKGNLKDLSVMYATSSGLVKYSITKRLLRPSVKNIKNRFKRSLAKVKELFYDYF